MFLKLVKSAGTIFIIYKIFKIIEKKLLEDEKYFKKLNSENKNPFERTMEEAKKHMKNKEYMLAADYFYYAYKSYQCDWSIIIDEATSENVKDILIKMKNHEEAMKGKSI